MITEEDPLRGLLFYLDLAFSHTLHVVQIRQIWSGNEPDSATFLGMAFESPSKGGFASSSVETLLRVGGWASIDDRTLNPYRGYRVGPCLSCHFVPKSLPADAGMEKSLPPSLNLLPASTPTPCPCFIIGCTLGGALDAWLRQFCGWPPLGLSASASARLHAASHIEIDWTRQCGRASAPGTEACTAGRLHTGSQSFCSQNENT